MRYYTNPKRNFFLGHPVDNSKKLLGIDLDRANKLLDEENIFHQGEIIFEGMINAETIVLSGHLISIVVNQAEDEAERPNRLNVETDERGIIVKIIGTG